jgi:BASS family bile acid:Na+ symporter
MSSLNSLYFFQIICSTMAMTTKTSAVAIQARPTRTASFIKPSVIFAQRSSILKRSTTSPAPLTVTAAAASAAAPSVESIGASLSKLANAATTAFPVFVLGAAALGLLQPTSFDWFLPSYVAPALGITMLGMGLTLTFADFARVLSTPKRIFTGFALQYTIMPAVAFAVSRLLALPLDFAVGLCIVGACPGGTASNVVTYLAKADLPLSVAMTTASTMGAVIATPLITKLLLGTLVPVDVVALLLSTVQVVLLPVLLGAALNQTFPKQVERLAPLSALSAVLLIAAICGSVIAQNASAVASAGLRLLLAVGLLHAGGFAFGYGLSKVLGMPEKVARTNSIEVGMQNSALGALLATTHFAGNPLAAVPCAISACTHSVMGSLLAAFWRTTSTDDSYRPPVVIPELDAETRRRHVKKWIADWQIRTGAPGAPSKWVTAEEVAMFSSEQIAFLERKRSGSN